MKKAIITGINGQDGSYLAELLLEKGYDVYGTVKRNSVAETQSTRIEHIKDYLNLVYADLTDLSSLIRVIDDVEPDEIYNLAAQSHVRISFDQPIYTSQVTGIGVLNMLEAVKLVNKDIKFYQASSSEMFGNQIDDDGYQRETTKMVPVSPYGCAKVFAYNITRNYRNSYHMNLWNGILFNHESIRRGTNFVTNKIAKGAALISMGKSDGLNLGNLNATRDWGHAKDYVKAMWVMLQSDNPDDYVCATGVSHSVEDVCEVCFSHLDLNWRDYVGIDDRYFRPEELDDLKGDSSKLKNALGWEPEITFEEMLTEMTEYWVKQLTN